MFMNVHSLLFITILELLFYKCSWEVNDHLTCGVRYLSTTLTGLGRAHYLSVTPMHNIKSYEGAGKAAVFIWNPKPNTGNEPRDLAWSQITYEHRRPTNDFGTISIDLDKLQSH